MISKISFLISGIKKTTKFDDVFWQTEMLNNGHFQILIFRYLILLLAIKHWNDLRTAKIMNK